MAHRDADHTAGLTATSYAALGQLALRPWTIYEMTKNISRTLRWFWPRAESGIYREIKQLHARGLVDRSRVPGQRGRPASRYSITPSGQEALERWLAAPAGGFTYHSEPLLRLHLAPYGKRDDLIRALEAARQQALDLMETAVLVGDEFATGRHQFQDQVHLRAMLFDHLWTLGVFTVDWAERCLDHVRSWEDLAPTAERKADGVRLIQQRLAERSYAPGR